MQNIDPTFLVLAAVLAIISIDGYFFRRRLRAAMAAAAKADYGLAAELFGRFYRSNSVSAWLSRLATPGFLEVLYGDALADAGKYDESLQVLRHGLARVRKPSLRQSLQVLTALVCAKRGDDAGMDEQLARTMELRQAGTPLSDTELAQVISALMLAGRIEEAEGLADERLADKTKGLWPGLFATALRVLFTRGRFFDIIRLFIAESNKKQRGGRSGSHDDDLGIQALLQSSDRSAMFQAAMITLAAADELGQSSMYDKLVCGLARYASDTPREQMQVHGALALRLAHDGDAEEVASLVAAMDRIAKEHPADLLVAEFRRAFLFECYFALGDYERALCFSHIDPRIAGARIASSQAHALRAKCFIAMGRPAEAEADSAEARQLAPGAFWNGPQYKARTDRQWAADAEPIDVDVEVEVVEEPEGVPTEATLSPVAPVASRSAWLVWGLAVFAFVPLFGLFAGMAMLIPAILLLLGRRKLPHDRRVATAGLVLGILAVGIGAAAMSALRSRGGGAVAYESGVTIASFEDERAALDPAAKISITQGVAYFLVLLISLTLHEVGHALAAYWSGDPTARDQGRITLNPIRHLSLFGSAIVPLVLYLMPGDTFIGWAKPVPVSPLRYRKWRAGSLSVNIAGVSMNLMLACVSASLMVVTFIVLAQTQPGVCISNLHLPFTEVMSSNAPGGARPMLWLSVLKAGIWVNALLLVFNLLPIPPLDGFGLLRAILPKGLAGGLAKLASFGMIPLLVVVAIGGLQYLLLPAMVVALNLLMAAGFLAGNM